MSKYDFYCHHCNTHKKLALRVEEESTPTHSICKTCSEHRKNRIDPTNPKYAIAKKKAYRLGRKNYTVPRKTNDMLHEIGVDEEYVRVNKNND